MYNARQKLQDNIAVLKIVVSWDGMSVLPEDDIQVLKRYSGFGGLKAILYKTEEDWTGASEADKKLKPLYDELYDLLESNLTAKEYKKVIDSLRNSTLSAFYTPRVVPDTIYRVLSRYMKIESLYEPSAGAGVYIESALENLPYLQKITAYEKDYMTAKICSAIYRSSSCIVHNSPFEESLSEEDGKYPLVASNVPFGAFGVYDPAITDPNIYKKIHAYFVAKGISKLQEGGVMAILITDAFLNSPTGKSARRYLFERCDLLSVVVMPDNLYKESAGTEAPSHLIVVRKNTGKTVLSGEEEELVHSDYTQIPGGKVAENAYIHQQGVNIRIGEQKVGKNQYGKPAMEIWWNNPIEDITGPLEEILTRDLEQRWIWNEALPKEYWSKKEEDELSTEEELDDAQRDYEQRWPIRLSDIPDKVKMFLPKHQQQVIVGSEEHWDILKNLENIIEQMPGPYGQDGVSAEDKIVYLHYFYGGYDWYITERDEWGIQYQMFGYANLGDDEMAEWGYIGVPELEDSRVELDLFWKPCRFGDIGKEDRMNEVFLNEDTAPSTITAEQAQRMLQQQINVLVNNEENRIWSADGTGNGIAEKLLQKITLPDTCSVEPVKGTIIQVEGKLVQIEQVHSDNTVTVVEPDVKAGKDTQVMEQYLQIRDVLNELEQYEK